MMSVIFFLLSSQIVQCDPCVCLCLSGKVEYYEFDSFDSPDSSDTPAHGHHGTEPGQHEAPTQRWRSKEDSLLSAIQNPGRGEGGQMWETAICHSKFTSCPRKPRMLQEPQCSITSESSSCMKQRSFLKCM